MPIVASSGRCSGSVPAGLTFQSTMARSRYSSSIAASRSGVLGGGSTLGIAKDVVTPPAAQADVAVTMSSLWVKPGSRWCEWTSIAPGSRWRPVASMTRSASSVRAGREDGRDAPVGDGHVRDRAARGAHEVPPRMSVAKGESAVTPRPRVHRGPIEMADVGARRGSHERPRRSRGGGANHSTMSGVTTSRYWA